jgi:sugar/nucleoside kinase (ribokinase family)
MIVVLGDIAVDIVSTLHVPLTRGSDAAAEVRLAAGGSGANVAVWLARLGVPVTFVGRIGEDMFGRWLRDDLIAEGVTPAVIMDRARGTSVIQVLVEPDGERTMIPDRGANAHWAEEDISGALIASADALHIVGYVLLDRDSRRGALAAMAHARRHGVPISLDPSSHAPLMTFGANAFWEMVGRVELLLPNRQEASVLSGQIHPEPALDALISHAHTIAVKLDRDGCLATDGDATVRIPAPALATVNVTGAGDAFDAAFLARWLAGVPLTDACRAAVGLGSFAVTLATSR